MVKAQEKESSANLGVEGEIDHGNFMEDLTLGLRYNGKGNTLLLRAVYEVCS